MVVKCESFFNFFETTVEDLSEQDEEKEEDEEEGDEPNKQL